MVLGINPAFPDVVYITTRGKKMFNSTNAKIDEFNIDNMSVDENVFRTARRGWIVIGLNIGMLSMMFLFF